MQIAKTKISDHYGKLAIIFIALAVGLVLLVLYFAFAKTAITVTAVKQDASVSYEMTLAEAQGKLLSVETEATENYTDLASVKTVEDKAHGPVTIYNNYSADQQLVATTRLLSKDGVLFRTADSVIVPKGGSVSVELVADQPGKAGDIGPSKFEIVALNSAKKELIYGESAAAMTGGERNIKAVAETDLVKAKEQVLKNLQTAAYDQLVEQIKGKKNQALTLDPTSVKMEVTTEEYGAQAGDEVEALSVHLKIVATGAAVNKQALLDKGVTTAEGLLENGSVLESGYTTNDISYTIKDYDREQQSANLTVQFKAQAKITADSNVLDKSNLIGKSATDVISYLTDFPEIESVDVKFSPAWVTKVPRFEQNIKIIVK